VDVLSFVRSIVVVMAETFAEEPAEGPYKADLLFVGLGRAIFTITDLELHGAPGKYKQKASR
jgi:hypothetical protein